MLEIARKKIPDVTLTLLDMRSFDLKRTFDLVTCQYSVLNYLTAEGDLVKALQCIRKHMAAGSWFLFDINSLNGLMNAGELVTIKSSEVIIINSDFNISTRIATLTTEGFFKRPDGLYERMVYVEDERGWYIDELEQIFSYSDFSPFEYLYTSNNKSPNELENEWRLFISVQAI